MNRTTLIGLGVVGLVTLAAIVIGFISANTDDAEKRGQPAAVVSPQATPSRPADTPVISQPATPAPAQPSDTPVSGQPRPAATIASDSPVRSGLPPTTPPDAGGSSPPRSVSPQPPPPSANIEYVDAPIESVDVLVLESFPVQYLAHIVAGLPSGCAKPYTYEIEREDDVIEIRVLNEMTVAMACTAIYGMYDLNINLGSGFQSGVEYTLQVNDETYNFTAQ